MKNFLFVCLLFISLPVFAQDKKYSFNLPKDEKILDCAFLPNKLWVVKTGKATYFSKEVNIKLTCLDADLNKKWEVPLPPPTYSMSDKSMLGGDIIISTGGKYVYVKKYNAIIQINTETGAVKNFNTDSRDQSTRTNFICADDDYFYLIGVNAATTNGENINPVLIDMYSAETFKYKHISLKLPLLSDLKNEKTLSTQYYVNWALIKVQDGNFYFSRNELNKKSPNTLKVEIAKVDLSGNLLSHIKSDVKLDLVFPCFGNPRRDLTNGMSMGQEGIYQVYDNYDTYVTAGDCYYAPSILASVKADAADNFYITGLYSEKPTEKCGPAGIWVQKLNSGGGKEYFASTPLSAEIMNSKFMDGIGWYKYWAHNTLVLDGQNNIEVTFFRVTYAAPKEKEMYYPLMDRGGLKTSYYTFILDNKSEKFTKQISTTPDSKSALYKYYAAQVEAGQATEMNFYRDNTAEYMIEQDPKKGVFTLLKFNKTY